MKKVIVWSGLVAGLAPFAVFAANSPVGTTCNNATGTITSIICTIGGMLNTVIPFLITLGIVYFVWGVISYVLGGSEEAKKEGRDRMIYGIIGLAVIVSVWGLVAILRKTFGLDQGGTPITIPCIVGTPGCDTATN